MSQSSNQGSKNLNNLSVNNNTKSAQEIKKSQEIEQKKKTILSTDLDLKFKIVLVGDQNVGKTSIFWRYIEDYFDDESMQESTVTMVDFRMKNQIIDSDLVKLYLWDTAGQERYRAVISTYFKGAHAVIGVFDLTQPHTFNSLERHWVKQCQEKSENAIFILVGNKKDLYDEYKQQQGDKFKGIEKEKIDLFCTDYNCKYLEVSAKSGNGVEDMFIELAILIKKQFFPDGAEPSEKIKKSRNGSVLSQQKGSSKRNSFSLTNNKDPQSANKNKNQKKSKKGCC